MSASSPGNPLKEKLDLSSGNEKILPEGMLTGIFSGEISRLYLRNEGSNSKEPTPVESSQAIAPAWCFQMFIYAVVIITNRIQVYYYPFPFFLPSAVLAYPNGQAEEG